jgi:hypothetical protein
MQPPQYQQPRPQPQRPPQQPLNENKTVDMPPELVAMMEQNRIFASRMGAGMAVMGA